MEVSNPFSWYEISLPPHERKRRGHFSTPPQLIEQLLDACGYTAEQNLAHLRVLDPACGSGNFLISATRRLIAFGVRAGLDDEALATLVQRNIWGFDPDPVACFLAEMQLQTTFAQEVATHSSVRAMRESVPSETQNTRNELNCLQSKILRYTHIHQADVLALPWEQCENVDLFLANPPYLASKNTDLSGYSPARERGQADSYLLFLRLALQVVRPNGWIILVLPDPLLARASAAIERQLLLAETTIHHLWHLSNVFTAYVGAVVIIAQKCPPSSNHQIHWKREPWQPSETQRKEKKRTRGFNKKELFPDLISNYDKRTVSQSLLRSQPRAELRYLLSQVQDTLVARLYAYHQQAWQSDKPPPLAPLDAFVLIRRGEEISKDSSLLSKINLAAHPEHPANESWYPVLRGGVDVRLYHLSVAQCWIHREAIKKPLERYLAPKILVVKSVGRLQAALDIYGHIVLQTLYLLHLRPDRPVLGQAPYIRREGSPDGTASDLAEAQRDEDDLYFLLALLNSRLLQQYVYVLHTAYKWVQPQIEQHVLMHLPIPTIATATQKEQIVQRSRLLMTTCDKLGPVVELKAESEELYAEQEQAICSLYTAALEGNYSSLPIGINAGTRVEAMDCHLTKESHA
jgi:hypothetical protein